MIVQCEKCSTRFRLADSRIGPEGTKVRCSKCFYTFVISRPKPKLKPKAEAKPGLHEAVTKVSPIPPPLPVPSSPPEDTPATPGGPGALDAGGSKDQPAGLDPWQTGAPADKPSDQARDADWLQPTVEMHARPDLLGLSDSAPTLPVVPMEPGPESGEEGLEFDVIQPDAWGADQEEAPTDVLAPPDLDSGDLGDELFSDLPPGAEEVSDRPFDPFAGALGHEPPKEGPHPMAPLEPEGAGVLPVRRGGLAAVANWLVTILAGAALLVGLAYFIVGDARFSVLGLGGRVPRKLPVFEGVHLLSMKSFEYATPAGFRRLVLLGEAENRSKQARENLYVVAELHDQAGKVVKKGRGILGVALGPADLSHVTNDATLLDAYRAKVAERDGQKIQAGGSASYTVVILEPPRDTASLSYALKLEKGEPIVVPEPEPEPEPEPAVVEEPRKGKAKAKIKRKRKRRKRRGKRRGKPG